MIKNKLPWRTILNQKVEFFNRRTSQIEVEKIYGDSIMRFLYENPLGLKLSKLVTNRVTSSVYGQYQNFDLSQYKVPSFVKKFNIQMDEYQPGSLPHPAKEHSYKNFNEFFIRKFILGKRVFNNEPHIMPAFSEARYVGFSSIDSSVTFPVKGKYLNSKDLLRNEKLAQKFHGGPLLIARLCPVDYHRFHFPDSGEKIDTFRITGKFDSVSPIALRLKPDIFIENERQVTILKTKNFGHLAYIEVGAMCVGKIIQTHQSKHFMRGEEKGYFLFGGSTVVVMGEKGAWKPSSDILTNTKNNLETFIQLGDQVALKETT